MNEKEKRVEIWENWTIIKAPRNVFPFIAEQTHLTVIISLILLRRKYRENI